jgi:hypothetical protein
MLWLPTARLLILKLAAEAFRLALPKEVAPSIKVTLPVAAEPLTIALSDTSSPKEGVLGVAFRLTLAETRVTT